MGESIRVTYSPEHDSAYIYLTSEKFISDHTEPFEVPFANIEVVADVDAEGRILGLEIPYNASRLLAPGVLSAAELVVSDS